MTLPIEKQRCPYCKSPLEAYKVTRVQTLCEHVFSPNETPCPKQLYRCSVEACPTVGVCMWTLDGELFTEGPYSHKKIDFIDSNDAPFGTISRKINVEVCKHDEDFTFFRLPWVRAEIYFEYESNLDGDIVKRKPRLRLYKRYNKDGWERYWHPIHETKTVCKKAWTSFRRFLRCNLYCRYGYHARTTNHDDLGITGSWTCNDCGHHEEAIQWPKPPPKKQKVEESTNVSKDEKDS